MSAGVNRTTVPLDLQELRLVAAAKAGDKLCYRELLARNQAAAYRAAYLGAGSSAEACAATQRACIDAWSALRRFPATARFGPWLALIAVREAEAPRREADEPRREARFAPRGARRMRAELAQAAELERRVEEVSGGVEFPTVPDLSAAVISRLPDRVVRRTAARAAHRHELAGRPATVWAVIALAILVAAGATALVPASDALFGAPRTAPGQVSPPVSSPAPPPLAALRSPLAPPQARPHRRALGERIPLTRARHAAGFTALLPPAPSAAYLGRDVPGGRLSLLAGPELITEFRGATIPYILTLIGPGSHAELTWVNGRQGVYGLAARTSGTGGVLTWLQGPLTLRIEGAQTLEEALALARSLR
jgi:DNA-directed RNA polymerase specialized sigma24 family protein